MGGVGGKGFGCFVVRSLQSLLLGSRAVREVLVRAAEADGKSIESEVEKRIGKERLERLKEEQKLRSEILDG